MKRILLAATLMTALGVSGFVAAQTSAPKADDHAAHHPGKAAGAPPAAAQGDAQSAPAGMAGGGMMGGGMMGGDMMGGGMMGGGMCPMMGGMTGGAKTRSTSKRSRRA